MLCRPIFKCYTTVVLSSFNTVPRSIIEHEQLHFCVHDAQKDFFSPSIFISPAYKRVHCLSGCWACAQTALHISVGLNCSVNEICMVYLNEIPPRDRMWRKERSDKRWYWMSYSSTTSIHRGIIKTKYEYLVTASYTMHMHCT